MDNEIKMPTEKEIGEMIEACRSKEQIILPIISKKQFEFIKKHFPDYTELFTENKFCSINNMTPEQRNELLNGKWVKPHSPDQCKTPPSED